MRSLHWLIAAWLLAPYAAVAQEPGGFGSGATYGAIQAAKSQWDQQSTETRSQAASLASDVQSYNPQAQQVMAARDDYLRRFQIYDNVISYRSKDDLEKRLDELRRMHGGVQRLGIVTDSSSYYRYYGKDNKWIYSIVQGDYDLLQRMRDDAERNSLRLRDMGAAIDRKYDRLVDQYNKAESAKDAYNAALAAAQQQQTAANVRSQVVGTWTGSFPSDRGRISGTIIFNDNGEATAIGADGRRGSGTWSASGNTVQISWATGAQARLQLQGNQLSGTTWAGGETMTISLQKR